jgi:Rad3-related DNA helicase
VSFALAKDIIEYSRHEDRMVISNDRDEILSVLSRRDGKIVLSPSIEKGYDFKGDMCRFQIVAKVPYGYIGDAWISLNMNRDSRWYSRKAILRIVQASGRAVRGVDDYATTYIVDQNFERLHQKNKTLFPGWYLDSLEFKV